MGAFAVFEPKNMTGDYALISGHPGELSPGNPTKPIPSTQGQYSSTKSYHCPSLGEHNLKGLSNCNIISCIIFELFFCKKKYLLVGASSMLWTGQRISE